MKTLSYSTISTAVMLGLASVGGLASISAHADVLEVIEVTAQKRSGSGDFNHRFQWRTT